MHSRAADASALSQDMSSSPATPNVRFQACLGPAWRWSVSQRLLTLVAGGRPYADRHQAAVRPCDRRLLEWPLVGQLTICCWPRTVQRARSSTSGMARRGGCSRATEVCCRASNDGRTGARYRTGHGPDTTSRALRRRLAHEGQVGFWLARSHSSSSLGGHHGLHGAAGVGGMGRQADSWRFTAVVGDVLRGRLCLAPGWPAQGRQAHLGRLHRLGHPGRCGIYRRTHSLRPAPGRAQAPVDYQSNDR